MYSLYRVSCTYFIYYSLMQVIAGRTFVLSDSFCKTKKYLLGLALDVPCITYSWLSDCIEQVGA